MPFLANTSLLTERASICDIQNKLFITYVIYKNIYIFYNKKNNNFIMFIFPLYNTDTFYLSPF